MTYSIRRIRLTCFLTVLVLSTACEKTPFNPEYEQYEYGLGLTVRADQAYFLSGSPIVVMFEIINIADQKRTFYAPDSQLCDLLIIDGNGEPIWHLRNQYGWFQMERPITLGPHQRKSFQVTCEDTLESGSYSAIGWFTFIPSLRDTTDFIILDSEDSY